ncbi:MAG: crossover junction endodeoxyribonuclease RuvC [Nitrospira sp.]|nr:crossover junction endodeoxyribonuclease RuvC [Candidatus Manganitrophaceae bacterium]HIL35466.1 crossover junction endodeoxyribonuclease RuvC [Candidatus Manganitrophaceae bacterium]
MGEDEGQKERVSSPSLPTTHHRILGIDPGIGVTGYAVLDESNEGRFTLIQSGEIKTAPRSPFPARLKCIFDGLLQVISSFLPTAVALEDTFYAKNFKSALKLGQAKGVALLAAESHALPIFEYAPTAVKMAVVGYGRATKEQVQRMVSHLLQTPKQIKSEHEADAVAIAICHAHTAKFQSRVAQSERAAIGKTLGQR